MLAPSVAKPESATPQRLVVAEQRPRAAVLPHRNSGQPATLQAVAPAWDLSRIPLFSPDRATPGQAQPPLDAQLPGVSQPKPAGTDLSDPLEHEADHPADQVVNGGSNVPDALRRPLEARLGHNFADIRVHADEHAHRFTERRDAHAIALPGHVFVNQADLARDTPAGRWVMAHELAHIAQMRNGSAGQTQPTASLEKEASENATLASLGMPAPVRLASRPQALALGKAEAITVGAIGGMALAGVGLTIAALAGAVPGLGIVVGALVGAGAVGALIGGLAASPDIPKEPKERYAYFLRDGAERLARAQFGQPLGADFEDKFDHEYWEWDDDPKFSRRLKLKEGKKPSAAINALFSHLGKWRVDCDHLVQIAQLWAQLNTLGESEFDQRNTPTLELRPRESSTLKTKEHYGRSGPGDYWKVIVEWRPPNSPQFDPRDTKKTTEELVQTAPVGSRIRFTNRHAQAWHPFCHENTLKVGNDLFAAGGMTTLLGRNTFSQLEVETNLAKYTKSDTDPASIREAIYIDEIEIFDTPDAASRPSDKH
ncbi:eCIS core domain-containing protein [Dyella silvatica]|uniref:eCIS core domain-containing protein n=1 Tax=Dyella silvatica TaxID=2992128 RepID=UPI00224E67AE|nr:DUF4157 domain-containing protein [Dyella silvatica]